MKNVKRYEPKPVELPRISGLVTHATKTRLDSLCRRMRDRHGWDYGFTFSQVVREGLDTIAQGHHQ